MYNYGSIDSELLPPEYSSSAMRVHSFNHEPCIHMILHTEHDWSVCGVVCGVQIALFKGYNLNCYYVTKHTEKYKNVTGAGQPTMQSVKGTTTGIDLFMDVNECLDKWTEIGETGRCWNWWLSKSDRQNCWKFDAE